jgi:hypothetical protein
MTDPTPRLYAHRRKEDGTHDSICLACLATIATQKNEDSLEREEEEHVCKFRFPSQRMRRLGTLPSGEILR